MDFVGNPTLERNTQNAKAMRGVLHYLAEQAALPRYDIDRIQFYYSGLDYAFKCMAPWSPVCLWYDDLPDSSTVWGQLLLLRD